MLHVTLFAIWLRFRHVIKMMADEEIILNNEFFGDTVNTPKEGIEHYTKRECLKSIISHGKAYLLRGNHK